MLKLACLLTGEDFELLKSSTPKSKKKVKAQLTAMMIPIIMWFATIFLFLKEFFHLPPTYSLLGAFGMSFLIFLIERMLLMSSGGNVMSWFRMGLGILFALIGGICIDEVIFAEDIKNQKILEAQESFNSHKDNEIARLVAEKDKLNDRAIVKTNEAKMEAQGAGSGVIGWGKIAKELQKEGIQLQEKADAKGITISRMIEDRKNEHKLNLENIRNGETDGALLMNLRALINLILSNIYIAVITLILFLFFLLLEFSVVVMKMFYPKTAYEERLEVIEKIRIRRGEKILDRFTDTYDPFQDSKEFALAKGLIGKASNGIY